jgi:hypothetical protein
MEGKGLKVDPGEVREIRRVQEMLRRSGNEKQ